MSAERKRMLFEFSELCKSTKNKIDFQSIMNDEEVLCQFILDPLSLNLKTRVSQSDPLVSEFVKLAGGYCHIIDKTRLQLLNKMKNNL